MSLPEYTRVPPDALDEPDDHLLFQRIVDHVLAHLGDRYESIEVVERIPGLPEAAKVVWSAWLFSAEVGSSGLAGYLLNHTPSAHEQSEIRRALEAVRAHELVDMWDAVVDVTRAVGSFLDAPEVGWFFNQLDPEPKVVDLGQIQDRSMELAAQPLSALVATYVRAQRSTL